MNDRKTFYCLIVIFLALFLFFFVLDINAQTTSILENPQEESISESVASDIIENVQQKQELKYIRGIHLTAAIASAPKQKKSLLHILNTTELNSAVIDIKEVDGHVCIDGVETAQKHRAYSSIMKNTVEFISLLKENNVYTIARIVVFCDDIMPRRQPQWAIKNPDGSLWKDKRGQTWLDPYNEEACDYIIEIAKRASDLGFDEIQFDYIRFPSDGNVKNCRYSKQHSHTNASQAILAFLRKASEKLKDSGTKISIDVFGMTTTATDDMGIGQKIVEMTSLVDYVSPMIYPSHYYSGEYNLQNPNKEPYKVVYYAVESALKRIPANKLRPWLQDFSLNGVKYGKDEVRAQIQACYDNGIGSWILWNAVCSYTTSALLGDEAQDSYQQSEPPTPQMMKSRPELSTGTSTNYLKEK